MSGPEPKRVANKLPSSADWRLKHQSQLLASIGERLVAIETRQRDLELRLVETRGELQNLRNLIDASHRESSYARNRLEAHNKRLDDLELEEARRGGLRGRGALVATGGGVAGGSLMMAIVELIQRVLT